MLSLLEYAQCITLDDYAVMHYFNHSLIKKQWFAHLSLSSVNCGIAKFIVLVSTILHTSTEHATSQAYKQKRHLWPKLLNRWIHV